MFVAHSTVDVLQFIIHVSGAIDMIMIMLVKMILVLLELFVAFIVVLTDLLKNCHVIFQELVDLIIDCFIKLCLVIATVHASVYLFLFLLTYDRFCLYPQYF